MLTPLPWKKSIRTLCNDERAAEVTELAIVLALIVAGSIALIAAIGPKIQNNYSALNSKLP